MIGVTALTLMTTARSWTTFLKLYVCAPAAPGLAAVFAEGIGHGADRPGRTGAERPERCLLC